MINEQDKAVALRVAFRNDLIVLIQTKVSMELKICVEHILIFALIALRCYSQRVESIIVH
jgi:hypothetical protein